MKKILFLFALIQSFVFGKIVEVKHFEDITSHLTSETLVILDIDDTLLIPAQMLGCDEWFRSRLQYHQDAGSNAAISLEKALAEWEAVRHLTHMQIVEPGTEKIVCKLQDQGYTVMALTTQGLALATRTVQHLRENQIDLSRTSLSSRDCYLTIDGHGVLFRLGILFTSGTHKGKALFELLNQLGYTPKRILFINDKLSHLLPVEEVAQLKEIEFIGLRYAYADAKKQAFDSKIANYQFLHSSFNHILSDEEAKNLLERESHVR